jgi:hypothetical protein
MTTSNDFDAILASVLRDDGPQVATPGIAQTAFETARMVRQRRPLVRSLDRRAWPAPVLSAANPFVARTALVGFVLLLVVAGAVALVGAARMLERRVDVFGSFEPTSAFPSSLREAPYVDTGAVLADGRVLLNGMYATSVQGDTWGLLYDPGTNAWSMTGHMPELRQGSTATTLRDGRVLIVGGWGVDAEGVPVLPSVGQVYDPATGTFTPTRGGLTTPRYNHTATLLADGRVLIAGGAGADFNAVQPELASAEIFDPVTGMFSPTATMSTPREMHTATLLADGRVLLTGGAISRETSSTPTAEVFDPAAGTFVPVGSMREARTQHAATALEDGRVLVVGGSGRAAGPPTETPLASAELFDPTTGTFAAAGRLATERTGPGALRLSDGRVLIVGGTNSYGTPRTAELFDPVTGRFERAGTSARPHEAAWVGGLPNGHVLVVDRAQDPSTAGPPELWSAFAQPESRSIAAHPVGPAFTAADVDAMPLRSGHTATLLRDGRILLTGGEDAADPGAGTLASAEVFDPTTGRSQPVDDMSIARSGHVAVLLADGRVLVAGGEAATCPQWGPVCAETKPRAEIFDPGTGHFTRLPADLGPWILGSQGNWRPSAALLPDGRVLFIGPRHVAVIIDPATGESARGPALRSIGPVLPIRLADGRVVVIGGTGSEPGAPIVDAFGRVLATMPGGDRWDAAVALTDGRILVLNEAGDSAIFDPVTSTFTPPGSMTGGDRSRRDDRNEQAYPRQLTLLKDGRVLVTGGRSAAVSGSPIADADLYDPATGSFEPVGPMHDPRLGHSATLLDDGRVVLIGGVVRSADRTDPEPAAVEIFDPSKAR